MVRTQKNFYQLCKIFLFVYEIRFHKRTHTNVKGVEAKEEHVNDQSN